MQSWPKVDQEGQQSQRPQVSHENRFDSTQRRHPRKALKGKGSGTTLIEAINEKVTFSIEPDVGGWEKRKRTFSKN
ncbi:hypothetical protein M408DRAFT_330531 [Serendipita vermifera MAFF 305830]|uniref:Uncharacterized protein n=1 Tax=Serendipita vermifera MAFF 305830 TaxID=933852 RepID=A0A0C3B323_SERVB|nr:hypothetical protein M408DRAFT_330531 [Serendipita vermifera MAFF 305830]